MKFEGKGSKEKVQSKTKLCLQNIYLPEVYMSWSILYLHAVNIVKQIFLEFCDRKLNTVLILAS